jgi:hypothetical protein
MAERVYEDLKRLNGLLAVLGVHPFYEVVSAYPLPAQLAPLFGDWDAGRIELFLRMAYGHESVVPPSDVGKILENVAAPLLAEWYSLELGPDPRANMARLESLVLEQVRPSRDHGAALPRDTFVPEVLLLCVGCAFGAQLLNLADIGGEWVHNSAYPFAIGLKMRAKGGLRAVLVNPIGKAFKLYLEGEEHRFTFMSVALLDDLIARPH